MNNLTEDELPGAATAVNLRLALGAPPEGPLPSPMLALLRRLAELDGPARVRSASDHCSGTARPGV